MNDNIMTDNRDHKDNNQMIQLQDLGQRLTSIELHLHDIKTQLSRVRHSQRIFGSWRPSIRFMLSVLTVLAILSAIFGAELRSSVVQARNADFLASQNALITYEPNESLFVALFPGPPDKPPQFFMRSLGRDFFMRVLQVRVRTMSSPKETLAAICALPSVRRVTLSATALLTREHLQPLLEHRELESLTLAHTHLTDSLAGVERLQLRSLDVSHTRVGPRAIRDISKCVELRSLNLERTAVTDACVVDLQKLHKLRVLNLKRCPMSKAAVLQLSNKLPACYITYEPLVFNADGTINVRAVRSGFASFGTPPSPNSLAW
ncbi:MAG: hypothetical protein KDB03_07430 [Planctomycetales bacterium]|nr:hypothetical protein [Planctomycetales bacterium]